jgi:chemotaxis protein MotB
MSKRRRKGHEEEHENHERWLITYADMITLLMAFFVMMYGMSILDLKKFADFKDGAAKQLGKSPAISGGQGILFAGTSIGEAASAPITGTGPRNGADDAAAELTGEVSKENIGQLVKEVRRRLDDSGLAPDSVEAELDPRGAVLRFSDRVLFESGSASLSHEGLEVLDLIALTLNHIDNLVVVEGHTDDLPTNGKGFATNWELSTYRATQVLRWLVQGRRLPAPRFSAAGYADTHPRVFNDTTEHRALNRRVEIIIIAAAAADTAADADADIDTEIDIEIDTEIAADVVPHIAPSTTTTTAPEGASGHGQEKH